MCSAAAYESCYTEKMFLTGNRVGKIFGRGLIKNFVLSKIEFFMVTDHGWDTLKIVAKG